MDDDLSFGMDHFPSENSLRESGPSSFGNLEFAISDLQKCVKSPGRFTLATFLCTLQEPLQDVASITASRILIDTLQHSIRSL